MNAPRVFMARTLCFMMGVAVFASEGSARRLQGGNSLAPTPARRALMQHDFGSMPLHFQPNSGQFHSTVQFEARGPGYRAMFQPDEVLLVLRGGGSETADLAPVALRLRLEGAKARRFEAENELPGKVNYYLGDDPSNWRTNIPTYARLRCREVYPGIDLVYYGSQKRLEYDFIVSPDADPGRIQLLFEGAERMEIDGSGDLLLRLKGGLVRQHKPVVFQDVDGERRTIEGNYRIAGPDKVCFVIGDYDRTRPLVIDPVLEYSSYFGSSDFDGATGIAVDASGNVVAVGFTASQADFPFVNPFQNHTNSNARLGNAFVMRMAPDGTLVYATYLGGEEHDEARAVAVDNAGNAYVTGTTQSRPGFGGHNGFPTTQGAYRTTFQSFSTVFVSKFNAAGGLVYSTFLFSDLSGGAYEGNGIAVDGNGFAFSTGRYNGPHPVSGSVGVGLFVAKMNLAGSALIYTNVIFNGVGYAIALDSVGGAHVAGDTVSGFQSQFFQTTTNAYETNSSIFTSSRAFYLKLDETGTNRVYCTLIGSRNDSTGRGIGVDGLGRAHLIGSIRAPNNPANLQYGDFRPKNALQSQFGGGLTDAYIARFDPSQSRSNSLLYATYLGGSNNDQATSIDVDEISQVYVAGTTSSTNFPLVAAVQTNYAGGTSDAFVAQLNGAGSGLMFSSYLGGSGTDNGNAVAVGLAGRNLYLAGTTGSTNFPVKNAVQPNLKGVATDAFATRIVLRSQPRLIALEVTQVLQDWQNTVPLVKGKPTFVRAFVEMDGPGQPTRVQPVLHGRRNNQALPDSPLKPLNPGGFIVARQNVAAEREFWDASLNFRLPESWTDGVVELELEAQDLTCAENPVGTNINDCKVEVQFQSVPDAKVKFVGIQWSDPGFGNHLPEPFVLRGMAARLKSAFPTRTVDTEFETANWSVQTTIPEFFNTWFPFEELQKINARLLLQYEQEVRESMEDPARLYYGALVHSSEIIPLTGMVGAGLSAGIPGRVASGFASFNDLQRSRHVHTHELGHLLGRTHSVHTNFGVCVLNGVPKPGTKAGACNECALATDPDYPLFQLVNGIERPAIGPMDQSNYDLVFGLDASPFEVFQSPGQGRGSSRVTPFVISPFKEFDLMSYCVTRPFGQWPSTYTYGALLDAIKTHFAPPGPHPPPGPRQQFFYVRGAINFDSNSVSFHPFTRLNVSAPTPVPAGEFTVRFLNATNGVLQDIPFAPMMASAFGPDPNSALFLVPTQDDPAIRGVQVFRGAQLFGSITASPNPPVVQVLSPNGGEIASGETFLIQWQASDPDGNPLSYDVQFSPDNGTNWSTLLIDGTQQQIQAPLFNRKGSTQARVRVTAKDGFHSVTDESDSVFTLQEQPPMVTIHSPQPFENFSGQQTIIFQGSAFDATDGELEGTNLVWRSHRDGVLGSGVSLLRNASSLALGSHTITLSATDNDGNTVERSVTISITTIIAPRLQGAPIVVNGNLEIEVFGEIGAQVTLQSSVDLNTWTTVQSATLESDVVRFTIPFNQNEPHRFYRAVAVP